MRGTIAMAIVHSMNATSHTRAPKRASSPAAVTAAPTEKAASTAKSRRRTRLLRPATGRSSMSREMVGRTRRAQPFIICAP